MAHTTGRDSGSPGKPRLCDAPMLVVLLCWCMAGWQRPATQSRACLRVALPLWSVPRPCSCRLQRPQGLLCLCGSGSVLLWLLLMPMLLMLMQRLVQRTQGLLCLWCCCCCYLLQSCYGGGGGGGCCCCNARRA